jgi:hypothetical protein
VGIEPERAAGAVQRPEPRERAERDRVVTTQDDGDAPLAHRVRHAGGEAPARLLDLAEKAGARVAHGRRLGDRRLDVSPVGAVEPELGEAPFEAGVPDRRGPHVDAAAAGAEIEGGADDRDLALRHGAETVVGLD